MNIIISNSSGEPIYEQIKNQIKNHILNEVLVEGDLLPSIRTLAQELKISVITTKRAYDELELEGFIETVPGKGCYVGKQNKEFLREKRIKLIEDMLIKAIDECKGINISLGELEEMIELLYNND